MHYAANNSVWILTISVTGGSRHVLMHMSAANQARQAH
jgi:hypothetical protein